MGRRRSRRYREIQERIDSGKSYNIEEAIEILKALPHPRFDETVELSCRLNVDPKKSDQMVRGSVILPHGLGKKIKVLVFCKGEKEKEAKEAGADYVGGEELIEKIKSGWFEFDVALATPDMMKEVGKIGKILGPRGLMPSPKTGTLTNEIAQAVKEAKAGKLAFKIDRSGNINAGIGKISFDKNKLIENIKEFLDALLKLRPVSVKGQYLKNVFISTSMGPGLKLDLSEVLK